jgi:flagellar basal body-associated protein FliL
MSEPVAPYPAQPPAPPPPPKKRSTGKILLIVAIVLVVLCGGAAVGAYFFIQKAVDVAYAEGNCVDTLPTTDAVAVPKAVKCTDAKAAAKILKVVDGQNQTAADAQTTCEAVEGATAFTVLILNNNQTKLLCLGPNQ